MTIAEDGHVDFGTFLRRARELGVDLIVHTNRDALDAGASRIARRLLAEGEDVTDFQSFRIWLRTGGDPQHPAVHIAPTSLR